MISVIDAIVLEWPGAQVTINADDLSTLVWNGPSERPSDAEIEAARVKWSNWTPVPSSVTPLQARKALRQAGMMAALNTWLATQPDTVTEVWEYALSIERGNPTLAAGAEALGLTDGQVDDLFRLAATL